MGSERTVSEFNKKDLKRKLDSLDEDRRKYAHKVLEYIDKEKRFDKRLPLAYLVLEGSMEHIAVDLEAIIFADRLYQYLTENGNKITKIMYSPDFIYHREAAVYEISVGFVADIAGQVLELLEYGDLKPQDKESRVFRFTADESTAPAVFPYEWDEEEA